MDEPFTRDHYLALRDRLEELREHQAGANGRIRRDIALQGVWMFCVLIAQIFILRGDKLEWWHIVVVALVAAVYGTFAAINVRAYEAFHLRR